MNLSYAYPVLLVSAQSPDARPTVTALRHDEWVTKRHTHPMSEPMNVTIDLSDDDIKRCAAGRLRSLVQVRIRVRVRIRGRVKVRARARARVEARRYQMLPSSSAPTPQPCFFQLGVDAAAPPFVSPSCCLPLHALSSLPPPAKTMLTLSCFPPWPPC